MLQSISYFEEVFIKNAEKMQEAFLRNPKELDKYVSDLHAELIGLGTKIVSDSLELIDETIRDSTKRKKNWHVESYDEKSLITTLGTVRYRKTLYAHKRKRTDEGKQEMCYLLDKVVGLTKGQRLTNGAVANVLEEAMQTSYRRAGLACSETTDISKSAVKDVIHNLRFPKSFTPLDEKKRVKYLYIDADEDHFHLQFKNKKGDLVKSSNGRKNNDAITKLIYVYEGIEPEAEGSKRNRLVGTHFFCRGAAQDNKSLWKEVNDYICATYDIEYLDTIYLNADGGSWIKEGLHHLGNVKYVLDEFHLSKYVSKMCAHMLDTADDVRNEIYLTLRNKNRADFIELKELLKGYATDETTKIRIEDAARYILNNFSAAKLRLRKDGAVIGSSTEGHVYHVLSKRMSTLPLGWCKKGSEQMARLLEYHFNKGDMYELAEYQKEALPLAVGAEELVEEVKNAVKKSSVTYTKSQLEYSKYSDVMSAHLSTQKNKQLLFWLNRLY